MPSKVLDLLPGVQPGSVYLSPSCKAGSFVVETRGSSVSCFEFGLAAGDVSPLISRMCWFRGSASTQVLPGQGGKSKEQKGIEQLCPGGSSHSP